MRGMLAWNLWLIIWNIDNNNSYYNVNSNDNERTIRIIIKTVKIIAIIIITLKIIKVITKLIIIVRPTLKTYFHV